MKTLNKNKDVKKEKKKPKQKKPPTPKAMIVAVLSVLACSSNFAHAKVTVSTGGSSDGSSLVSTKGPKGPNATIVTSAKGGSITKASAKSLFTKKKITHGNKVVSAGTAGDEDLTHVSANSAFAGTATFHSDDGEPVENFTIDMGLNGSLRCKNTDPELEPSFSLAKMSTDLVVDGAVKFAGAATQDGADVFTATGNLSSGDFTTASNSATIHKTYTISLGTLTDGQKLPFFFAGSTLVSYGEDVGITFCEADFFNTDTFQATKAQGGKLTIAAGKPVTVGLIDDPDVVSDEVLYIESPNATLLGSIDTVKVIVAVDGGTFDAGVGIVGDVDEDGIPDLVITATNPIQSVLVTALQNSFNNTVIVYGETSNGEAVSGSLDLSALE